jgi:phytoene synthase
MAVAFPQPWERTLLTFAQEARHSPALRAPAPIGDRLLRQRAYRECKEIISAHGKTFNMASALLAPAKRRAIRALYAFCRVSDDIVDCPSGTRAEKQARLSAWRQRAVSACPTLDDPMAVAWADTRLRYRIPDKFAEQLIEGVARDLRQARYSTFEELAVYMYGVASTVGLMSMRIIGLAPQFSEEEATPYIIKLGLALQMTNILRDVGEDRRSGRVYLPSEELEAFGLTERDLASGQVTERWRSFMRFQIERNRELFTQAWPGVGMFSSDGRFAVAAACELYSGILTEIERHDYDVFNRRAHVSAWGKARRLPGIWWRAR